MPNPNTMVFKPEKPLNSEQKNENTTANEVKTQLSPETDKTSAPAPPQPNKQTDVKDSAPDLPDGDLPPVNCYLVPLIFSTLFCCLPVAVPGLFFSIQTKTNLRSGNYQAARESSKLAKLFFLIAFGIGTLGWLAYFAYLLVTWVLTFIPR